MNNVFINLLSYISTLVIKFIAYQLWAPSTLIGLSFLIISWINFSNDTPNLYSLGFFFPILKLLGVEDNATYGNEEILALVAKVSFIFGTFGIFIELFLKKVLKYDFKYKKKLGFIFITLLFLFALLSCFSSGAKERGSISIIPALVILWIFAIVSYALYLLLDYYMQTFLKAD